MKARIKNSILILAAVMACQMTTAHPHYPNRVTHYAPHCTKTLVTRTIHVRSQKERMSMLVSYLRANKTITASEYAELTGLDRRQARTELDSLCLKGSPVKSVVYGKDKVYVMR